jgi:hypothetical protein
VQRWLCPVGRTAILAGAADQPQPEAVANVPLVTLPWAALDPMVALATTRAQVSTRCSSALAFSTGAGVLTGWQVVTDLVRKVAPAHAPDDRDAANQVGDDPEAWWAQHGDRQPLGYSRLLGTLASLLLRARHCLQATLSPLTMTGTKT